MMFSIIVHWYGNFTNNHSPVDCLENRNKWSTNNQCSILWTLPCIVPQFRCPTCSTKCHHQKILGRRGRLEWNFRNLVLLVPVTVGIWRSGWMVWLETNQGASRICWRPWRLLAPLIPPFYPKNPRPYLVSPLHPRPTLFF